MMQSITQTVPPELAEKIKEMAKPGVVFSEPVQAGEYVLITASRYKIRKDRVTASPVGVILINEQGVKVQYMKNNFLIAAMIPLVAVFLFSSALILHPPWNPEAKLLDEVRELIKTIRKR